jgi:hypothetical protein
MKACRGNRGVAPLVLNFSTRWGWMVSIMTHPLYPCFKSLQYLVSRGMGRPQRMFWRRESGIKLFSPALLPSHHTDAFPGFLAVWIKIKFTLQLLVCVKTDVSMEVCVQCGLVSCDVVYVCSVIANHPCFGGLLKDPVKCYVLSTRLHASTFHTDSASSAMSTYQHCSIALKSV